MLNTWLRVDTWAVLMERAPVINAVSFINVKKKSTMTEKNVNMNTYSISIELVIVYIYIYIVLYCLLFTLERVASQTLYIRY